MAKQKKIDDHAAAAAAAAHAAANPPEPNLVKSPSDFSCHSYELFVGQEKGNDDNNKEKMSIKSEGGDSISEHRSRANGKVRKVRVDFSGHRLFLYFSVCRAALKLSVFPFIFIINYLLINPKNYPRNSMCFIWVTKRNGQETPADFGFKCFLCDCVEFFGEFCCAFLSHLNSVSYTQLLLSLSLCLALFLDWFCSWEWLLFTQ